MPVEFSGFTESGIGVLDIPSILIKLSFIDPEWIKEWIMKWLSLTYK
ncbi:MAG: hypothetical protein JW969_10595 [Spirochaetales bacterium]|nr:hypothetical protein [Spirochaetales bacterium]